MLSIHALSYYQCTQEDFTWVSDIVHEHLMNNAFEVLIRMELRKAHAHQENGYPLREAQIVDREAPANGVSQGGHADIVR